MKLDKRWAFIHYKLQEYRLVKTFDLFRKHNIEPILIKGLATAKYYPEKEERLFIDIDICVAPSDFKQALEILVECKKNDLLVDLHNGLRHLDTVGWANLFENSQFFKVQESDIRILRPEDHLRVLCVNWLKDGGASKERLWDIYYAVRNRPTDFDWDRCLETIDQKRRKWIVCAIGLAHLYLNLDLSDTPIAAEAVDIPIWVINTVEKEWADEIKLKSLVTTLSNKNELFQQLKKRFPPNPIQATIEVNGKFNDNPRVFYQFADICIRLIPLLRRFLNRARQNTFE